ncbi:ABC transporter permease [Spiroplasma taiwanense]|uniref:ABC transporter permease n=1 Tax=Spiroplasma taiwanense CT-1 TaxID=1276220 RepID=S5M0J4_9MOLU|nr:ABC transporter permease [Spiroplasma taiwanense]AGR41517.1 ABC transporter permease [Spiroplasma taiwanense CT-1]
MNNIFKSYIKLFIKSWVETLGTIIFLIIFTMLIMGMLATPLQLSLKASSIKRETSTWQEQRQTDGKLSEDFIEKFFTPENQINGSVVITKVKDKEIKIDFPIEGWFSEKSIDAINKYLESLKVEIEESCNDSNETNCEENYKKSEKNSLVSSLFNSYKIYHDSKELILSINEDGEENKLKINEIFTPTAIEILNSNNRSLNSYIIDQIISQLSSFEGNSNFNYSNFNNVSKNFRDSATNKQYLYFISSVGSLIQNSQNLNNLVLQEGRLPTENNEIILNDAFMKKQNLSIGDNIKISENYEFKIVGIGIKYSTLSPIGFSSFSDSIDNYAQIFTTDDFFKSNENYSFKNIFLNEEKNPSWEQSTASGKRFRFWSETYVNNYNLDISINEILTESSSDDFPLIFNSGSAVFKEMTSHSVIKNLTNLYIITWIYAVIGGILFILAFFFILFVLKKEINNTRRQLGVFKSLGYKTSELTWIFAVKTFITMIIAIAIGYLLSMPFQIDSATKQFNTYVIFDYQIIYSNVLFLFILIIGVPLIFSLFSYLSIFKYLSEGALALLSSGPKKSNFDWLILILKIIFWPALIYFFFNWLILKILKNKNFGFTFRMQHAFVSTGKGKFALIMGLFAFSSFLFTLQLRTMPIIENMIDGAYNIYSPETNHLYNFKSATNMDIKKDGLSKNITKPDYHLDFVNVNEEGFNSIKDYVDQNSLNKNDDYYYTSLASNLINAAAELKTEINKNSSNSQQINSLSSIVLNFAMLLLPLEEGQQKLAGLKDDLINSNFENILKFLEELKNSPISETSLILIKPETLKGLYLNDIAQYLCVSTPSETVIDCTNIEEYKESLLSSFNTNKMSKKDTPLVDLNISDTLKTLVQTFFMTKENINPFISINSVLFEGQKEALMQVLPFYILGNSEVDIDESILKLFDTTSKYGGDLKKIINFSGVNDENFKELTEVNDDYINGIISFRLSRLINKNIGDTFEINIGNKGLKQKIKIVAINLNDTMLQNVYVDYKVTIDKIGKNLSDKDSKYYFNEINSTKLASEGKIDFADIGGSINSFKNLKDTFSFASSVKEPWVGNILDIFVRNLDISQIPALTGFEEIIREMKENINAPKDINFFMEPGVISLPILKSVIDELISKLTNSMLMYILIDIVLLTILLVVIMNIIISDSINIITIMRSLGYSNRQINWMVMGKYITGAFISFVFAFLASVMIWYIIQAIVWEQFKILILVPSLPWIPFVSLIVLGAIIYIGWLAAMFQIKKRPLTLLVS